MKKYYAIFVCNGFNSDTSTHLQIVADGFTEEFLAEHHLKELKTFKDMSPCRGQFLILPYYEKNI